MVILKGVIGKIWTVLIVIMALSSLSTTAQEKKGKITGQVVLASEEQTPSAGTNKIVSIQGKSFFLVPVSNATIELITGKDTLRKVSNLNGYYTFSEIPYGEYLIKARHISYISSFQKVKHFSSITKKDIQMKEEIFLLDAITVKGEIPLLITRGDTVIINPLAVKTMEGDAAIEILRQVPGIRIDQTTGAITAFGRALTRTYVGGKLIFGEDARAALDNLDATLVKKMKIYDEVTDLDMTEDGRFEAKTRRVLNIETTKEILSSRTGHAIAGLGKDLNNDGAGGNNTRYRLGGTINFFSEKLFYNANVFTNNTNTPNNRLIDNSALISTSTGEERIAFAGVGYKKVWGDNNIGSNLELDYSFNNRNSSKEKTLENIYFPNNIYSQREYISVNTSTQSKAEHKTAVNYRSYGKIKGKKKYISLSHSMIFSDTDISDYSETTNIVNENTGRLHKTRLNNVGNYSIQNNINTDIITNVNLTLSGDFRKDDGDTWRVDSLFSESSALGENVYRSSPIGLSVNLSAKARYARYPSVFAYEYQIDYQKGKSKEIRYDLSSLGLESIDNNHSFDYSTNNTTHIARMIYAYNKKTNFFPFGVTISLKSSYVNKDELIPFMLNYSKTFNSFLFSIDNSRRIGKSDDMMRTSFTFRYNTNTIIPSVEQLRNQINDSDPLFLVVGSSELKQTYVHTFALNMRSFNPELSFNLDVAIMQNQIVPKQQFFLLNTVLPEYNNYLVPANSTLTTYDNLNGAITSSLKTYYSTRISSIKTLFTLTSELSYNRRPSYIQEIVNITNRYGGQLKLSFSTSFPTFKINLSSISEYVRSINTEKKSSDYFNQNVNFSYDYNIGKYLFTRGKYNLVFYEPLTKGNIGFTNNILSLSGGLRLFKGKLNIDLTVYDIFNKSTNFKSMMYSDYVQNSWTPTFGRYWSFNVSYKFRSTKSPSNIRLNDGFVPIN